MVYLFSGPSARESKSHSHGLTLLRENHDYKADHDCYSIIFSQYIDEDLDYI